MTLFVWPATISGLATESTLADILTSVDGIEGQLTTVTDRLSGSLVPAKFDYIAYTDGGASETFVYKTGGSGGTTQKTITVTYTDASKAVLVSVAAT